MKIKFLKFCFIIFVTISLNYTSYSQYSSETLGKYLTSSKQLDEVDISLSMIKNDLTNYYPSEITAAIKKSYPSLPEDKTIRVLPYVREHMISEGKEYERVKRIAGNLLKFMYLQERVRVIYFDSEVPVTAFSYPYALIVSSAAEQLLSDDELEAVCAHEIMHLIVFDHFKDAIDKKDFKKMRSIELFCDGGAISIIDAKGKDAGNLISGLEKMQSVLEKVNNDLDTGIEHPTLKQRRRFYKELTQKFNLAMNRPVK